MIGLDTNILLRWLIDSGAAELGSSKTDIELVSKLLLSDKSEFFVNPIVIAETTWILEQKLKLKRHDLCEVIDRLLYAVNITLGEPQAVKEAREAYEGSSAGFADCLLGRMNIRAGCSHTLTFDKKASRLIGFRNFRTAGI